MPREDSGIFGFGVLGTRKAENVDVGRYCFVAVEVDASNLTDGELQILWNEQDRWMGDIETAINQTLGRYPVKVDSNIVMKDTKGRLGRLRKKK